MNRQQKLDQIRARLDFLTAEAKQSRAAIRTTQETIRISKLTSEAVINLQKSLAKMRATYRAQRKRVTETKAELAACQESPMLEGR